MILQFSHKYGINENAVNRCVNQYVQSGQGLVTSDLSPRLNLTGCMYTNPWEYMSIQLMNAVWHLKVSLKEKIVLLCLADHAKDSGDCWPSVNRIAARCSISIRSAQSALKSLEKQDLINRNERSGRSTLYSMKIPDFHLPQQKMSNNPRKSCTQNLNIEPSRKEEIKLWKIKMGIEI